VARPAMGEAAKLAVLTRANARCGEVARLLQDGAFRGFENPLPRTQEAAEKLPVGSVRALARTSAEQASWPSGPEVCISLNFANA
jgi:hypothetical protein